MANKKRLTKKITEKEVNKLLRDHVSLTGDPDAVIDNLGKAYSKYLSLSEKEQSEMMPELNEKILAVMFVKSTESHITVMETVSAEYQSLVKAMTLKFIEEYSAETPSEISLAQIAAIEYVRTMEFAKHLNSILRVEFIGAEKNGYYNLLGKELDRAERRMIRALTTLKQMKQPPLTIAFKANTAFVAQNQQVNATQPTNDATNADAITPK